MLVVTRKKDERLIIGDDIEIQVLRIGRENVRLGIKAPAHVSIYRYEIYEAIKEKEAREGKADLEQLDETAAVQNAVAAPPPEVAAAPENIAVPPKARAKTEDR